MRRAAARQGFTLIEMLTVVAIIILVMAMALPNFAEMLRAQRWSSATLALQSALRRCRSYAVNARRDHAIEICFDVDNETQYLRIETESAVLESIPEMNDYYRNQCGYIWYSLPVDWPQIFRAGGGEVHNDDTAHYYVNTNLRFVYAGPKYDVDGTAYRVPNRVKDNLMVDDVIELPHGIRVDFAASLHLGNFDAPPGNALDMPQYGWDMTPDLRFSITGVLVQTKNPEVVLVSKDRERMRLQILRSAARVRRITKP